MTEIQSLARGGSGDLRLVHCQIALRLLYRDVYVDHCTLSAYTAVRTYATSDDEHGEQYNRRSATHLGYHWTSRLRQDIRRRISAFATRSAIS